MAKPKNAADLAHPVEPSRWAQIRQAERVDYSTAQPISLSWKTGKPYTCPELQHRSAANQPPSLLMGRRVSREG
ncbi:MAG: hypothetical protein Q8N13_15380 [Acidovorax sp.]|nr:hypothetical protein [Acidovorax sp.]